ncbi:hypothetical protein KP509_26G040700 [Ceratopteris richardii]|uniref:Uncharacterized protein n=1 Tax=Ceratopteris richardii TaxID=49495 RepID=A0A8T2RK81_CERRI|nr:hypothetical protein KP509_26G040700 [Ceratopteris richardii]
MFDMDTPISIDVHPSSPPSRLQSPEPSGTPDLARISAHRETALFGYSHGILHMEDEKASPSSTNQRFEFVETSICQPDHKRLPSQSSLPELENGRLDMVIDCEDDLGFTR